MVALFYDINPCFYIHNHINVSSLIFANIEANFNMQIHNNKQS